MSPNSIMAWRVKGTAMSPYKYDYHLPHKVFQLFEYCVTCTCYMTRDELDSLGIEAWWEARFSAPVQTAPGVQPASYTMASRVSFPGVKQPRRGGDHRPVWAEVKERVVILLFFIWAFMACSRVNFTLSLRKWAQEAHDCCNTLKFVFQKEIALPSGRKQQWYPSTVRLCPTS